MTSVSPFSNNVDICNRALQHLGARRIFSLNDNSKSAAEVAFCYDKVRVAEMRRSPWRFATRRANLRVLTATSYRFVPQLWVAATSYGASAIVMDSSGVYWISMIGSNVGNVPGVTTIPGYPALWTQYFGPVVADLWSNSVVYDAGEIVYKTGRTYYINTANAVAVTTDPAAGAPWAVIGTPSADWTITLMQPAGTSKIVNGRARNMFPLPNGYLRPLSPDPKVESTSTLNTSGALQFLDYSFEGNYIISSQPGPLLLRFVADVSDVPSMDSLFAEGLAMRIAYSVCEPLTQSNIKLQAVAAAYSKFMNDARVITHLESGNTEPMEDEYVLSRGPQGVTEGVPASAMQGEQGGGGGNTPPGYLSGG
jgi:hypothetical protein